MYCRKSVQDSEAVIGHSCVVYVLVIDAGVSENAEFLLLSQAGFSCLHNSGGI